MSKMRHPDIDDNQIRFISSLIVAPKKEVKKSRKKWRIIAAVVFVLAIVLAAYFIISGDSAKEEISIDVSEASPVPVNTISTDTKTNISHKAYTYITDTVINGHQLTMMYPIGGIPELSIGEGALNDSTAALVVQAADIRGDNGKIVGAFVSKGNLISTGQSKAGFCAIIGGQITIGVAGATPYLEEALDTGGDFFRQYPLVVSNQVVENKPKGASFRKALAEFSGRIVVILSRERMTFHDFSQSLVDLGVTNAIYLVGSTAYGFARDKEGNVISFGKRVEDVPEYVSFMVWRN